MDMVLRPSTRFRIWRAAVVLLGVFVAAIGAVRSDTPEAVDDAASSRESSMPWIPIHSIWFFSSRTEIDQLEKAKFVALAAWVDAHAGSEIGISLPAVAADPESAQARTGQLRVEAIREAMVAVGIPESRIHVGAYGGPLSAVDRRVVIYVRAAPASVAAAVAE